MKWMPVALLLVLAPSLARANGTYQSRVPGSACGTCHVNPSGGGTLNAFGSDFRSAGYAWTSSLQGRDSDGDGWSNREELDGYSNPGVAADTPSDCRFGYNTCHALASCYDSPGPPGSYTCMCRSGYMGDGRTCTDVDECVTMTTSCAPGACTNVPGNWTCTCPMGWVVGPTGHECRFGCAGDPCGPGAIDCSESTALGYECLCAPGEVQYLNSSGRRACAAHPASGTTGPPIGGWWDSCCGLNAMFGSSMCVAGECVTVNDSNYQELLALSGDAFSCQCTGFGCDYFRGGFMCTDDDECASSPCGAGTCENRLLGYRCTCPAGLGGMRGCHPVAECDAGSIDCCDRGYAWDAIGDRCVDIDECTTWGICGGGTCTNSVGSYGCTCTYPYEELRYFTYEWGWVETCVDRDDCASSPCWPGTCTDRVGGYDCACPAGYVLASGRCADVDECASSPCAPGACINSPGSYACTCPSGYRVTPDACVNLDECAEGLDDCAAGIPCQDLPGSFSCGCTTGWREEAGVCVDVDECALGTHDCDPARTVCRNLDGGYSCDCGPGYEPIGGLCGDVDECALGADECDPVADCVNEVGSYRCVCPAGTMLVGLECRPAEPCAGRLCGVHELCVAGNCECEVGYERAGAGPCRSRCGDGVIVAGELCDDGNAASGDGCDACAIEPGFACHAISGASVCERTCGNGLVDRTEECDDGDANDDSRPDACRTNCRFASCGDAVVDDGERCDDGSGNDDTRPGACRSSCVPAHCGDGVIDEGELCDPGTGSATPSEACAVACGADAGVGGPPTMGGCGCRASGGDRVGSLWALALACLFVRRRRAQPPPRR